MSSLTSQKNILALSILVTSICAIVYQLLISSLSSYLLGSSILHFSLTIGCFMFFMGVGSYISRFFEKELILKFIYIEYWIGLIGGFSAFLLYMSFSTTEFYYGVAFTVIALISTLIGLEIPIVTRFLGQSESIKGALSTILSVDYLGALIASIAFPLILLPYLGIMKTSFLIGMLNVAVATYTTYAFRENIQKLNKTLFCGVSFFFILGAGLVYSNTFVGFFEKFVYQDEIIYSSQTKYQKIILTKHENDIRLFLNGNLQFSSIDEYRYHEPLVHLALSQAAEISNVLILGGGDGMAVREVLKHPDVQKITLVDLDPAMTELAKKNLLFTSLNKNSLDNSKVKIINKDAYNFLELENELFSSIIIDLPDPNDLSIGKLYTKEFFELAKKRLSPGGTLVTQSSSPYLAREAFWCVNATLEEVFKNVTPYHIHVPSFGPWGFNLAWDNNRDLVNSLKKVEYSFLSDELIPSMLIFDSDMSKIQVDVNRLDNQALVSYYEKSL